MRITETVYNGRNNTIDLKLTVDNVMVDHTFIVRVVLKAGGVTLDSNTSPGLFDMTNTDKLILKLGMASLPAGRYSAGLVVYDLVNTNGIVWGDFNLIVTDDY